MQLKPKSSAAPASSDVTLTLASFLPYRLNDPGVYKQDLGLERWGDRELHKVKVTFEPGSSNAAEGRLRASTRAMIRRAPMGPNARSTRARTVSVA